MDCVLFDLRSDEVERTAIARAAGLAWRVLRVDRAYAGGQAGRADDHLIADGHGTRKDGSGYDRPGSLDREAAVDRQPETAARLPAPEHACGAGDLGPQRRDPLPRDRGDGEYLRICDRRAGNLVADCSFDFAKAFLRHQIGLGQRDETMFDAKKIDDGQVLSGLRHDAVVGRDDQQDEIDAARAGKHRVNEFLVTRDVDEAERIGSLRQGR